MNLLAVIPTWGIVLIVVAAVVALAIIGLVVGLIVREKRSTHAAEDKAVPLPGEGSAADDVPQSQTDARPEEAEEPPVSKEVADKPADRPAAQKPAKQKKPAQASQPAQPAQGSATEEPAYEEPVVPRTTTAKTSTMRKQKTVRSQPQGGSDAAKEESSMTQENLPDAGEQVKTEKAKPATKTYHVSKRKSENKWQVKMAGGSKAIKMFITQAEAIDFAKKLAENQEAKIVIHKEDGSFRRLTYHKKK